MSTSIVGNIQLIFCSILHDFIHYFDITNLLHLLTTAASDKKPLSAALMKDTHQKLMEGLLTDGEEIDAGE